VRRHRIAMSLGSVLVGAALALAPISAAGAHNAHRGKHHHTSTKVAGSAPNSAMCQDVKQQQGAQSGLSSSIGSDLESGNFAAAKQALLNAFAADQADVQKALAVIKTAPANVQAAFKNILTYVQQIKSDIEDATSLQGLIASFESLGKNTQLESDGATIANWYSSVCGGPLVTTTTVSVP